MKYIIFNSEFGRFPVLFPESEDHSQMAHALDWMKPVSAGFVYLENGVLSITGKSNTLRMGPDPDDIELVRKHLERI